MEQRKLAILGSTGSVGVSTLDVVRKYPDRFRVVALAAGDNIERLAEQALEFRPQRISVRAPESLDRLRRLLHGNFKAELLSGTQGAEHVASHPEASIVVSAFVGAAGLRPTLAAVRAGKAVALANKETMVVAGALVRRAAEESGAALLPVDSEHSAIFQALGGAPFRSIHRLWLTASGGPFFRKTEIDLSTVTPEEALAHPKWKMGPKISIDSATLMNKGLEIIEARWLFSVAPEQIEVVIHPQSVIHSMVEFRDRSVLAQLGVPDMRGPIAYALSYPERLEDVMESVDFFKLRELNFYEPDHVRFPSINLARKALASGETYPAVLNGANEVAVDAFLKRRIRFTDIIRVAERAIHDYRETSHTSLEDFIAADEWGRGAAQKLIEEI